MNTSSALRVTIVTLPALLLALVVNLMAGGGGGSDTLSPTFPTEVPVEVDVSENPIDIFDEFSWNSFIALNWPAKADVRGEADKTKGLGNADLGLPRVWETWKADYELFQPGGLEPSKWESFKAATPCTDVLAEESGKTRILGSFTQFGDMNQAALGEAGNPLVAQNRTYVRYELRINKEEYDFIANGKLYLLKNLPQSLGANAPALKFTDGSTELKAAWKELKSSELEAAKLRYYTIQAKVPAMQSGQASETRNFALVGFHIVQKTPKRPQWVWSSFEHVDNLPKDGQTAGSCSFNDLTKEQKLDPKFGSGPLVC